MTTEQLTHRQIDAWAVENLMGLPTLLAPDPQYWNWVDSQKGICAVAFPDEVLIYKRVDDATIHLRTATKRFSPITDANDDAKVRKAVLEMKDQVQSLLIANAVYLLWHRRAEKRQEHGRLFAGKVIRYAETGDWTIAAYAVSKGLDPVELWKSLQGESR